MPYLSSRNLESQMSPMPLAAIQVPGFFWKEDKQKIA